VENDCENWCEEAISGRPLSVVLTHSSEYLLQHFICRFKPEGIIFKVVYDLMMRHLLGILNFFVALSMSYFK